jgi:uncharacterized membrane protein YphA (DoxX/SURF4 family)
MNTDRDPTTLLSAGLLILRLVVGVTFLLHGLDKLSDLAAAERFFASLDIPAPGLGLLAGAGVFVALDSALDRHVGRQDAARSGVGWALLAAVTLDGKVVAGRP